MRLFICYISAIFLFSCTTVDLIDPSGINVHIDADDIRFAAFGDYGDGSNNEAKVAELVHSLSPDFVITLGDNNYPNGSTYTLNEHIGKFYCDYIYNFDASIEQQCKGQAFEERLNRFFPSLGNHDYENTTNRIPYLNYFTLPGNEIYYDFIWGPVHFYAIDSNYDLESQRIWLTKKIAEAVEPFNVVFFHHPPYSSGNHGNNVRMQWDFEGVDLVLNGHDHIYERNISITKPLPVYIISGLGGKSKRLCYKNSKNQNTFNSICYDENYGTLIVEASQDVMDIKFISVENEMIDHYIIEK
ncbi:metallophosphoesterase [Yeosuana sp. MJ-SS3]|uniref:Metallophosphoesterase n=1 Tax=Gilvirhabdus luticola TaxID=3079858 RepID=A0ABU3U311_9FLAO|nr:metallophosphoesterase [Yeosuana sp. MJ-SS3]MDU8884794.1 metallophosphoesterase [Yeosuana sp. MJ-SS3]